MAGIGDGVLDLDDECNILGSASRVESIYRARFTARGGAVIHLHEGSVSAAPCLHEEGSRASYVFAKLLNTDPAQVEDKQRLRHLF